MTFDIANAGRYVFYVNFRSVGTQEGVFAEAEQMFNFSNLIEDSRNYVVAVERFRVPIQTIPMLPRLQNFINVVNKNDATETPFNLSVTFSLNEFMQQLTTVFAGIVFSLTSDGRMQIDFADFQNFFIRFSPTAAEIFDTANTIGFNLDEPGTFVGASPIFDRFDQLHKIQIEAQTGLASVQQEIITTQIFRNLLTDFLLPSTHSMSYVGTPGVEHNQQYNLTYNVREDIEFNNSSNRRFIMLKGNAPIQNIKLEVTAIFRDGTRNRILMPPRGVLEIKLGFYKKG